MRVHCRQQNMHVPGLSEQRACHRAGGRTGNRGRANGRTNDLASGRNDEGWLYIDKPMVLEPSFEFPTGESGARSETLGCKSASVYNIETKFLQEHVKVLDGGRLHPVTPPLLPRASM